MTTSNKDLIAEIMETAETKGVDIPVTDGKNNAALVEILDGLKNTAPPPPPSEEAEAKAKEEAEAKAKEEAEAEDEKPPYYMAPGKCVTSKRGPLADGVEVKAEDFPGGQNTLDNLVKKKYVIKS